MESDDSMSDSDKSFFKKAEKRPKKARKSVDAATLRKNTNLVRESFKLKKSFEKQVSEVVDPALAHLPRRAQKNCFYRVFYELC